jgi:AcrR family transcriptional regulator
MPLPRFDNLDPAQRTQILAAAQTEFAQHGYEATSLAQIAARAGISKGTLYYYFADRDDLYATVVLRVVQAVGGAELLGGFAPKSAAEYWPALSALFQAGFQLAQQHPEEMRALRSFQTSLRRHPRPAFEPVLALMSAHFRLLVESGRRLGCVRTDLSAEQLVALLLSVDEVFDREIFAQGPSAGLEPHRDLALDTFRRLAEPRQARSQAKRARTRSAKSKGSQKRTPRKTKQGV